MSKENVNPARKCERSCYQFKTPSTLSSWVTSMLSVRFRSSFQLEAVFYGKGGPEGREPEGSTPSLSTTQPLRKGCSSLIEQTGAKLPRKASPINATWHLSLRSGPACVCTSVLVKCCSRAKWLHVHVIKQNKAKPKPNNIPKWHVIFFLTKNVILLWRGWAGRGGRKGDKGGIQEPIHLLYVMYF